MIALVILLCATEAPNLCEQHKLPAPGMLVCLTQGQAEAVRHVRPGMQLRRWSCEGGPA